MTKEIQTPNWSFLQEVGDTGRVDTRNPTGLVGDPAVWNLPATLSVQQDGNIPLRQYTENATGYTISVSGLPAGVTYNAGTESLEGASTGTGSATATFTLTLGATTVVDTATVTLVELGAWQLAETNFVAAKMPMVPVYPRPDAETATWARHRHAYPGIQYRIPITVQGGAYPFRFELLEGPDGMAIGEQYGLSDYGIITWTPTGAAPAATVRVRVYDQEHGRPNDSFVDFEWQVTAGTGQFIFIDSNVATSGDGTISSPLKTFDDIHLNSKADATYAGKILYLRGGTHFLTGPAENSGNFNVASNQPKPISWLGYPGESAVLDCSGSQILFLDGGSGNDSFFAGFEFTNSRPDVGSSKFKWYSGGSGDRSVFFEMHYSNCVRGTVGNDNPGTIVKFDQATPSPYWSFVSLTGNNNEAPLIGSLYSCRYVVVEGCDVGPRTASYSSHQGIFLKRGISFASVRRCVSTQQTLGSGLVMMSPAISNAAQNPTNVEYCYNTLRQPTITNHAIRFSWETNNGSGDQWFYRNTVIGRAVHNTLDPAQVQIGVEKNVVVNNDTFADTDIVTYTDNVKVTGAELSNVLDAEYKLTGSYRTQYLGTHGAEIA